MLLRHFSDICEPYEFEKENATTGEIEIIKKMSDCLSAERSLLKQVKAFLASRQKELAEGGNDPEGTQVVIDEDEDQADEEVETVSCCEEDEENACEVLNSEL